MRFVFLISLFIVMSCGKENLNSNQSQSSNNLGQSTGILNIAKPGVIPGNPSLTIGSSSIVLGTLSQQASSYVNALRDNQVYVMPISQDTLTIKYRVRYTGNQVQDKCPFNPMAQCTVMNLQYLEAY
jgi:hypothetical protein